MSAQTVSLSTLPNLLASAGSFASETVLDVSLRSLTAGGWAVVLPEDSTVIGMPRGHGGYGGHSDRWFPDPRSR
jgi:hypothetical protein